MEIAAKEFEVMFNLLVTVLEGLYSGRACTAQDVTTSLTLQTVLQLAKLSQTRRQARKLCQPASCCAFPT